jgi:peptidoglycan/xylan/chitin deacetylase (PgdA/CDA1 family)
MKRIYLTFDDGPDEHLTPMILDILAEWRAKATFFVCGRKAEKFPQILRRIAEEGHSIGNHTYSHSRFLVYFGILGKEIERTEEIIYKITGVRPILFRPPWGVAMPWVKEQILKRGYKLVLWDIETRDWKKLAGEEIARKVKEEARDGAIVLLHDGDDMRRLEEKNNTLKALNILLPELVSLGYEFSALSQIGIAKRF